MSARAKVKIQRPDDICPVCKTSRYMRPNMNLQVNPVCYHRMCESCVDRLFGHGPAKCPIKDCNHTLRKNRFRDQTFEDLRVEREVDIRRRVAAVFNKREEEFESLRDWNDYLNDVEDITFNLINNIDVEMTQKRFEEYERMHKEEIRENASLESQEQMIFEASREKEKQQAKLRREAARREEAEDRREIEVNKRDMLRRLENGQDPNQVTLKKRLNRREAEQKQKQKQLQAPSTQTNGSSNLVIKGLRTKVKREPEAPIDPFGGIHFQSQYYFHQDDYVWDTLQQLKGVTAMSTGGYEVSSFTNRALCEAFLGLGVIVADEATEREKLRQGEGVSTTAAAEVAKKDIKMEDPF